MTASTTTPVAQSVVVPHIDPVGDALTKQYHKDVYACALVGAKAGVTMAQKLNALIDRRYNGQCPTFEQYRDDQKALAAMARAKGLVDNQWVRKPYAAAIKARFGALPVSLSPEAILKAAKREADRLAREQAAKQEAERLAREQAAGANGGATPGAVKGDTTDRVPSAAENLESLIATLGTFNVLDACIRILESDKSTKTVAVHMKAQASKAAQLAAAATITPAPTVTKGKRAKAAVVTTMAALPELLAA